MFQLDRLGYELSGSQTKNVPFSPLSMTLLSLRSEERLIGFEARLASAAGMLSLRWTRAASPRKDT